VALLAFILGMLVSAVASTLVLGSGMFLIGLIVSSLVILLSITKYEKHGLSFVVNIVNIYWIGFFCWIVVAYFVDNRFGGGASIMATIVILLQGIGLYDYKKKHSGR